MDFTFNHPIRSIIPAIEAVTSPLQADILLQIFIDVLDTVQLTCQNLLSVPVQPQYVLNSGGMGIRHSIKIIHTCTILHRKIVFNAKVKGMLNELEEVRMLFDI